MDRSVSLPVEFRAIVPLLVIVPARCGGRGVLAAVTRAAAADGHAVERAAPLFWNAAAGRRERAAGDRAAAELTVPASRPVGQDGAAGVGDGPRQV